MDWTVILCFPGEQDYTAIIWRMLLNISFENFEYYSCLDFYFLLSFLSSISSFYPFFQLNKTGHYISTKVVRIAFFYF